METGAFEMGFFGKWVWSLGRYEDNFSGKKEVSRFGKVDKEEEFVERGVFQFVQT